MTKSKPNDETQSFINLLIEELNKHSEQCPDLKRYVFCVEDGQWIAKQIQEELLLSCYTCYDNLFTNQAAQKFNFSFKV